MQHYNTAYSRCYAFCTVLRDRNTRSGNIDCHQRCIGNVHNSCDGNSRHNNRSSGYGNASEHRRRTCQRIKHRMDDACSHAGILHAAGIRTGRSRFHTSKKHCQHPDEKLRRFHVRLPALLVYRFRPDVRRRRIHRDTTLLRPFIL